VPAFYTRSGDGLPRGWLKAMKRSISTVAPVFNTNRMVQEYTEKCYGPAAERFGRLTQDNLKKASELARWRQGLSQAWQAVRVEAVESNGADPMRVGGALEVKARVHLGSLSPDDVEVQLFHGVVDNQGEIPTPGTVTMSHNGPQGNARWMFRGTIPCRSSGQHGFAVRVLPRHGDLGNPFETGLMCWG
jgi:starch phosphorylase